MERLGESFDAYWDALHALLATRLASHTLALFGDLPGDDASAIAAVVDGGKKLRGVLLLAVCDALGGVIERALPSAAAIECVHAASLVHDDLIDGDQLRRERPATWVVHGSRRAVLLADVIFATALSQAAERGRRDVQILARAIAMLAAGAHGEPLTSRDVEGHDAASLYERTIRLKTGSLFAAAAELGAIAAGARRGTCRAAAEFGARIGEAYQIVDDLTDAVIVRDSQPSQQHATRTMLAARFGGSAPSFDAARIASAMKAEVECRVALARDALAAFPSHPRLALLQRVPRAIVRSMMLLDDRGGVAAEAAD